MQKSTSYSLKKWMFGAVAFVAMFATEVGVIAGTSRFLNSGLIEWLPLLLLLLSVGAIFNFVVNLLVSKWLTIGRSTVLTFVGGLGFIVICYFLQNNVLLYLFLTLLAARLGSVICDTAVTNLSGGYVNPRQAKSFLPFIRGVIDLAILTASASLFGLSYLKFDFDPLWILMVGVVAMIVLTVLISRYFEPTGESHERRQKSVVEKANGLRQSMGFVFKDSPLLRSMAWMFFLFGGVAVLFVFVYNQAFSSNMHGDDLTRMIALVNIMAVILRAIFDFAFLKPALSRIGVGNLLLIYPWAMFLITIMITVWTGNLYIAALLFIFHTFSYYSYVTVASQAMFGVVPQKLEQQAYFLIKGVMPSVAAFITAGMMALIMYISPDATMFINLLLFLFVAGSMAFALKVRQYYQGALVLATGGSDDFVKANAIELMGEKVQVETGEKILRKLLLDQTVSVVLRQKAMISMVEIGNPNSIRELLLVLQKDENVMMRFYAAQSINMVFEKMDRKKFGQMNVTKLLMLDVFNEVYEQNLPLALKLEVNKSLRFFGFEVLLDFYKRHFVSSSDFVKASIIEALSVAEDRGLITLLEPYLESQDLGIRAAAIAGLWRFDEMRDRLMVKLLEIFGSKELPCRLEGLKLISKLKIKNMDDYVLDLVAVQDKQISAMAVITSINLGRTGGVKVLIRKLVKAAMFGDTEMITYILKRFALLPENMKQKFLADIRALSSANFDQMKSVYQKANFYFDLELANLFNN